MEKYFKEKWEHVEIGYEIKKIDNTTIFVNNLQVDFKTDNDCRDKNVVKYTAYIPYSNTIFSKKYKDISDTEELTESNEFNDEVAKIREEIERSIAKYLRANNKLINIEF
ncbi:hypothetical protein [Clostridioides sp. ZZV14-6345]|uniref:hypothetical protein n=1 Tax=Clostridioides sp. ZZV14-6345 TaxID=2811496 RepID=UPI001D103ACA|nr:hypothetical protein [Clostridioides sp. ZZV14-6345]